MRFRARIAATLLLALPILFCGEGGRRHDLPEKPVSIRGWVSEIQGVPHYGQPGYFYDLNVYVEGIEKVSGSIAEDGSFIILGVPAGSSTIVFQAPGIDEAAIHFEGLPSAADILIPGVILTPTGASLQNPEAARVRVLRRGEPREQIESQTTANGELLPTFLVPREELGDRLNRPTPPARGGITVM
jgi:hypothetical protein